MTTTVPGLRERKKQLTRETIADAALRLTLEKGLENVTVEEIAEVAFVSPRTVSNYFAAKEEAVVAAGTPDWLSVVDEFAEGPRTDRPLATLCQLFSAFVLARTPEELRLAVQTIELVERHPSLRPWQTTAYDTLEEALRDRVAERTGTDPTVQMYPWLVAAAAAAAVRSAMRLWASMPDTGPEQLPEIIRNAFNQFSDGLPAPSRAERLA